MKDKWLFNKLAEFEQQHPHESIADEKHAAFALMLSEHVKQRSAAFKDELDREEREFEIAKKHATEKSKNVTGRKGQAIIVEFNGHSDKFSTMRQAAEFIGVTAETLGKAVMNNKLVRNKYIARKVTA